MDIDIKSYDEFMELNEAMSPEEKKRKRQERRAKKKAAQKGKGNQDDIDDIEDMEAKPSKSMTQAVEKYRTEMVKFQELQKEFVLTDKNNVAKRESLKKKLIAQSKIAKKAEADFERMVAKEEGAYEDELFFESFDITRYFEGCLSGSTINEMEESYSSETMSEFLAKSSEIINELKDAGFDYEDILEFLSIKMDEN